MLDRLKELPTVQKLSAHYDQLSDRDRKALRILAAALVVTLAYLLIWRPIADFRAEARADMKQSRKLVEWVRSNEEKVATRAMARTNEESAGTGNLGDRDLMQTVTDSAERADLPLQRFEGSGEDSLRIWLEGVAFIDLTQWLAHLETKYGITVDEASIDRRDDPGLVDANLILET